LSALLCAGELEAGFVVPSAIPRWIAIPKSHWLQVGTDELLSLYYKDGSDKKTGAYKVRLREFASEYVLALTGNEFDGKSDSQSISLPLAHFREALALTQRSFEVKIDGNVWQAYLAKGDISDPSTKRKATPGDHQREGWRELTEIVGAYIASHFQKSNNRIKHSHAAEEIYTTASAEAVKGLPGKKTIAEVLSKIEKRLRKPRN